MRKIMKKSVALLLSLLCMTLFVSCDFDAGYLELGFRLSGEYREVEAKESYDMSYTDDEIFIGVSRYSFSACIEDGILTTMTPRKFSDFYKEKSGVKDASTTEEYRKIPHYTYTKTGDSGREFVYTLTFYRTDYAYFIITFITTPESYFEREGDIYAVLDTVYIRSFEN